MPLRTFKTERLEVMSLGTLRMGLSWGGTLEYKMALLPF